MFTLIYGGDAWKSQHPTVRQKEDEELKPLSETCPTKTNLIVVLRKSLERFMQNCATWFWLKSGNKKIFSTVEKKKYP